jgi:hypothetical protein
MRFIKPMLIVGINLAVLGAIATAFVFSPLYLDLMISLHGSDSKNEYVILLSERNNSRGIWALDLPKDRYTERTRPGFSEIFSGWFTGKPIRMPTYDETDINLNFSDFSFFSDDEYVSHLQDRSYWNTRMINLRVQGENWQFDGPMWYRPAEIAERFEPAETSPIGTTAYKIKSAASEEMLNRGFGCSGETAACKSELLKSWFLALQGSSGKIDGVISCMNFVSAMPRANNRNSCSGEFVFPNKRHAWFDAPYMEKEKVRDFYDRVWVKLKELTVYSN